ncbi:MAG: pyruvate kinase [Deltaproteobacteria bacterium]|nr:pyruvate kinase [Deltaproteobacteria bacterium]
MKHTKIIATLGPSLNSSTKLKKALDQGVNVFRLNFSHGSIEDHLNTVSMIRSVAKTYKRPVGILADMPGPKIRIGVFAKNEPVYLARNATCTLTNRKVPGSSEEIPLGYDKLPSMVKKGDQILLADGMMELKVLSSNSKDIQCKVVVGGELRQRKGINIPNRYMPISPFTERDREILKVVSQSDIDYVALSFVQKASDIVKAKSWMKKYGRVLPIIAKIEKPQAVAEIDEILKVTDAIMIARGDLGVEVPSSQVPVIQKQLILKAAMHSKPVITATQMLESMTFNPRPTRAESTDVANAIWDGTDTVMLSGETAMGKYPIAAIKMMSSIIKNAESNPAFLQDMPVPLHSDADHIIHAASTISKSDAYKAVIVYTESGKTAISLSKTRPRVPIYALTPSFETYRRMSLIWGVKAFVSPKGKNVDELFAIGDKNLIQHTSLKKKDPVIVVAGTGLSSGATNILKIHHLGESAS